MIDERLLTALSRVIDPEIRRPITELGMIADASMDEAGVARIGLQLTIVGCPAARTIERDVRDAAASVEGVGAVDVDVSVMSPEQRAELTARLKGPGTRRMPFGPGTLTRVYAVTSGKGGVGKSTLTANLAVALAGRGLSVGLVDADVHGFSIPGILGLVDETGAAVRPTRLDDMILPPVAYGVKTISIGMFLEPADGAGTAVAWRGPMLHRTVQQFLTDVWFGDLDVLLLDLPPGTGDVAISIGQLLPNAEVLVVTTPQAAAAEVAERSGLLAAQTGQTVVGVIENMAGLPQPDGSVLEVFGSGGGVQVADRLSRRTGTEVPLLASVPISVALRTGGDVGEPVVVADPSDPAALALATVADRLAARPRDLTRRPLPFSPA